MLFHNFQLLVEMLLIQLGLVLYLDFGISHINFLGESSRSLISDIKRNRFSVSGKNKKRRKEGREGGCCLFTRSSALLVVLMVPIWLCTVYRAWPCLLEKDENTSPSSANDQKPTVMVEFMGPINSIWKKCLPSCWSHQEEKTTTTTHNNYLRKELN